MTCPQAATTLERLLVVSVTAPLDRLDAADFYNRLDYLRDDWACDEHYIARRLQNIRAMFEHLPTRYYERALPLLGDLARARIVNDQPWRESIQQLRALVSEWDRDRPPLLACERCGVTVRGHSFLRNHLYVVHGIEGGT